MKININRREAHTLSITIIASRAFMGIALDGFEYLNSGWICILLGYLLALPLVIATSKYSSQQTNDKSIMPKIANAIFAIIAIYESAAVLRILTNSAEYCALSSLPALALMIFILACAYYAISKNGRGCGNAAKLWLCIFIPLMVIVFIAQYSEFNIYWLTPIFAPGVNAIIDGGVTTAGYFAAAVFIHINADGEYTRGKSCFYSITIGAAAAAILCLLRGMLAPALLYENGDRLTQLDVLLTNGRSSISLQLPLIFAWFTSLIATLLGYGFIAARCAQSILPKIDGKIWIGIVLLATLGVAVSGFAESAWVKSIAKWEYIALAVPLLACSISGLINQIGEDAKA